MRQIDRNIIDGPISGGGGGGWDANQEFDQYALLEQWFPGQNFTGFTNPQLWEAYSLGFDRFGAPGMGIGGGGANLDLLNQGFPAGAAGFLGDQAPSNRQLRGGDVGASMTGGPTITPLTQENYSEDHAKTYIPIPFRMRHHRIGSRQHVALLGARIVLTFVAKKACAEFCRAWNDLMSHIGQAEQFIPNDVVQAFSDVVIGGSGQFGMTNGFSPPFRGRIGV